MNEEEMLEKIKGLEEDLKDAKSEIEELENRIKKALYELN